MGFHNVIAGDGIALAITGMLIVFAGLFFISFYIAALPRLAAAVARGQARRAERRKAAAPDAALAPGEMDPALRAAIGFVLEMEAANEAALDDQRITIQHDESQHAWAFAGKMRTLSTRI